MILFNPLRRGELEAYKDKSLRRANRGARNAFEKAEDIVDDLSKISFSRRTKKIILITFCSVSVLLLSMYIPAWILGEPKEVYYSLAYDPQAIVYNETFTTGDLRTKDFDNDGITNEDEGELGTNYFCLDTDNDGFPDKYEIENNMDPLKEDSFLSVVKENDKKKNKDISDPYTDEDVILWPDSYDYKASEVVIKDMNGYIIKNYKGWAQFPKSFKKHVYNYKNGKLKKMKYREKEDAYYIKEDSYIVILEDKPVFKYRISVFGSSYVFENKFFGNILSFVLPSKGRTYLKCEKLPQIETLDKSTQNPIHINNYTNDYYDRLKANTNQFNDLVKVWNTLSNGECVYVSLYKDTLGESIGVIYGSTNEGDLLVADAETGDYAGKLTISLNGHKLYKDETLSKHTWFEFIGLGFNSKEGDRINFFGKETSDNYIDYFS